MKSSLFTASVLTLSAITTAAEPAVVTIEPSVRRKIGGVTELDRKQFLTIHASARDGDLTEEEVRWLTDHLQVSYGRDGGVQTGMMSLVPSDPLNPDMPNVEWMRQRGAEVILERQADPTYVAEHWRDVVLCTHPEYMFAVPDNDFTSWGPRTHEAAAEFTAQHLKHFYTPEMRPKYLEVFNEPFIKIAKLGTTVEDVSQQHIVTARRIRELTPDVQVGGYSAAWMEVEARDFDHWNGWMKTFIDIAGAEMDFLSYHLYDGSNAGGVDANRTGSNSEAILDLMTTYPILALGEEKPLQITEHGRITTGGPGDSVGPYNPPRVAQLLGSVNSQVMTFMDHPDRITKTVPFLLTRAMWSYKNNDFEQPYTFIMWRQAGENSVLTEVPLWYELWRDVTGEYRWATTDDPDIRVQVFADDMRMYIALANLESEPREVSLDGLDDLPIARIRKRSLETDGDVASFAESTLLELPETMTLRPSEGVMLLVDFREAIGVRQELLQERYYADSYLHTIEANKPVPFTLSGIPTDAQNGILRVSIGRAKERSLSPTVTVNGVELEAPTDWAGDDQVGRTDFFGMLEFPVPSEAIGETLNVELVFPDDGGRVATVVFESHTRSESN
ncbi:MAG: beta-agarase [Planctomycetota bacterium]